MGVLDGKVVLITGGGNGIGKETALLLAREGAKVVVNDLGGALTGGDTGSSGPAEAVAQQIRAAGGEAVSNSDSVSDFGAVQRMVEQAKDTFGGLHAIVNPAGILRDGMFHKMTEEDWDSVIDVHLKGSFNTSRAAATYFREQGSGAFVHMTSTSGLVGNFGQANYAAAKLGIVGLSKSLALDMSRFGVRSNCISPFAWSRLIGTIPIADEAQAKRVENIKTMTTAKIAPVAAFLLSDAASEVSGQIFGVRKTEIFLFSQHRPVRSVHRDEGWTPKTVAEHAHPAMKANYYPLDRSQDVFSWEAI